MQYICTALFQLFVVHVNRPSPAGHDDFKFQIQGDPAKIVHGEKGLVSPDTKT